MINYNNNYLKKICKLRNKINKKKLKFKKIKLKRNKKTTIRNQTPPKIPKENLKII